MRKWGAAIAVIVGLVGLFVVAIFGVSELGAELVTLETRDPQGALHATRLWVVDDEGHPWLRSGLPDSGWLIRIEADPEVFVTRGGERSAHHAVPVRDPVTRDRIHALMLEKYGWAEQVIAATRDGSASVPIRLEQVEHGGGG